MTKKVAVVLPLCMLVSILLFSISCAKPALETTKATSGVAPTTTHPVTTAPQTPMSVKPKYGGTLVQSLPADPTQFDCTETVGKHADLYHQKLWMGDWTKGPAGGYGTKQTDWAHSYDLPDQKKGFVAETVKWSVDATKNVGTIVFEIRQGTHYGLNPRSEASRLVNGRELTADDVVYDFKYTISNPRTYIYKTNPELRVAEVTKTGAWEVSVKVPVSALMTAVTRFADGEHIYPPETMEKYGDLKDWKNLVGSGPFMLTDYVTGSMMTYIKNPSYWEKDPIGPGKDSQLPYVDGVKRLIISDMSTRLAALRTGKIDQMIDIPWEEESQFRKSNPQLKELERTSDSGKSPSLWMRTDKAPFNDARVRRALVMATDYQALLKSLFGGKGQYVTFPYVDTVGYHDLYLGPNDADTPPSVKELFTYSPDKAKQLLKDAGYPNGLKTSVLVSNGSWGGVAWIDYYSVIKDMWSKIGVDLALDVKESGVFNNMLTKRVHEAMAPSSESPVATFYLAIALQGTGRYNLSMIDDPVINKALDEIRLAAITDIHQAMKMYREKIAKYVLDQAYAVPAAIGFTYNMWWPWVKNYSGEMYVGYDDAIWPQYIWVDQDMKREMGY